MNKQKKGIKRRAFLDIVLGGSVAAATVSMVSAVLMYLWPGQAGATGAKRVKVGPVAELPAGASKKVMYHGAPVIVVNVDGEFKAFSAKCTHLQCVVAWDKSRKQFVCPCHGATFDVEGQSLSSITSKALPRFKVSQSGGIIHVEKAS